MKIFFDTEFESLCAQARLVSIGLITEDGISTFYAELTGTYSPERCSEFCRATVLPLLEGGHCEMATPHLQRELWAWLKARGPSTALVCDSPRDVAQIDALFPFGLPVNCSCEVLGPWASLRRRVLNVGRRLHKKHGLRAHHALDDARVNRLIFATK